MSHVTDCRESSHSHVWQSSESQVTYYSETCTLSLICGMSHVTDCRESSLWLGWNTYIESCVCGMTHVSDNRESPESHIHVMSRSSKIKSFSCVTVIRESGHTLEWNIYVWSLVCHDSHFRGRATPSSHSHVMSHSCHVTFIQGSSHSHVWQSSESHYAY